jgi:oligoendopeptidase F
MFYADIPPDKAPLRREQDYPIYGNAIWYMGPLLQTDLLLARAGSRRERIALVAADVRRIWDNFVQGVVAADFESRLEAAVAAGHPPAGEQISQLYAQVVSDYYGGTGVGIEPFAGEEWMARGPIFYGHVMDEWAFAMAAAVTMASHVGGRDEAAIAALRSPLSRPGSYSSNDLLRDAGADLAQAATYQAVFRRMDAEMDVLDREMAG